MPSPKRYFHCSQDLPDDPEVWEMMDRFGGRSILVWLKILARLDQTDNCLKLSGSWEQPWSNLLRSYKQRLHKLLAFMEQMEWISIEKPNKDYSVLIIRAHKHLKYYRKRKQIGSKGEVKREEMGGKKGANRPLLSVSPTPTPTPTPKERKERMPVDSVDSGDNLKNRLSPRDPQDSHSPATSLASPQEEGEEENPPDKPQELVGTPKSTPPQEQDRGKGFTPISQGLAGVLANIQSKVEQQGHSNAGQ